MRIAIASSGLGRVLRGIERWAFDTAKALHARGVNASLFGAGKSDDNWTAGCCSRLHQIEISSPARDSSAVNHLVRWMPPFLWRYGLKSGYGWEQLLFWLKLWPHLRKGNYDVLHVQDPMLAYWCELFRSFGVLKTIPILAHGTEEPIDFLSKIKTIQRLAPWHAEMTGVELAAIKGHRQFMIPNFVDCDVFRPPYDANEKAQLRKKYGIPTDGFVVGCVATLKRAHKRCDYVVSEFMMAHQTAQRKMNLVMCGGVTDETESLIQMTQGWKNVVWLMNVSADVMPEVYRTFDCFVLGSVFEMMPIAILEAMASGVPVICHQHPVMEWMIGCGFDGCAGISVDMGLTGELFQNVPNIFVEHIRWNEIARNRACEFFNGNAVIMQYIQMYLSLIDDK